MTRRFAVLLPACLMAAYAVAKAQPPDASAPKVTRILEPAPGATFPQGGIVYVQAEVRVPGRERLVALRAVALEVDHAVVSSRRWSPYVFRWDTTRAEVGKHELRVKVTDVQGRETVSQPVPINLGPRAWNLPPAPPGEPLADATWKRLLDVADGIEADLHLRHDRQGLIDNIDKQPVVGDDPLSGLADPRGPLLTGTYAGACAYWYATLRDPQSRARAHDADEALHLLSVATGTGGLLSRWSRQTTQIQPDEGQPGLSNWRQNGNWRWLGDASPLDYAGAFFGHALYYDLVADQDEKPLVAQDIRGLANRLLEHDLVVTNAEGLPVPDGDLSPRGLSRPYNAILALGFLKIAYHVTADKKFDDQYWRLIRNDSYHQKGIKPQDVAPEKWGPYDDYAAMLMYCCLLDYEQDAQVREAYLKGLDAIFQSNDKPNLPLSARRPLFNIIYKRFHPDAGVQPQAVQWLLDSRSALGDSEWLLANWMGRYYQIIR